MPHNNTQFNLLFLFVVLLLLLLLPLLLFVSFGDEWATSVNFFGVEFNNSKRDSVAAQVHTSQNKITSHTIIVLCLKSIWKINPSNCLRIFCGSADEDDDDDDGDGSISSSQWTGSTHANVHCRQLTILHWRRGKRSSHTHKWREWRLTHFNEIFTNISYGTWIAPFETTCGYILLYMWMKTPKNEEEEVNDANNNADVTEQNVKNLDLRLSTFSTPSLRPRLSFSFCFRIAFDLFSYFDRTLISSKVSRRESDLGNSNYYLFVVRWAFGSFQIWKSKMNFLPSIQCRTAKVRRRKILCLILESNFNASWMRSN